MKRLIILLSLGISLPLLARENHRCGTLFIHGLRQQGILPAVSRLAPPINPAEPVNQTYKPGDQRDFWTYDLSVMPPKNVKITATCRAVGDHSYVFVADDQWGTAVDQAKVDAVLKAFETATPAAPDKGIYETDTSTFGDPPDVDGIPEFSFLFTK